MNVFTENWKVLLSYKSKKKVYYMLKKVRIWGYTWLKEIYISKYQLLSFFTTIIEVAHENNLSFPIILPDCSLLYKIA